MLARNKQKVKNMEMGVNTKERELCQAIDHLELSEKPLLKAFKKAKTDQEKLQLIQQMRKISDQEVQLIDDNPLQE